MLVSEGWSAIDWLKAGLNTDSIFDSTAYLDDDVKAPYIITYDIQQNEGSDTHVCMVRHELTLYRYTVDGEADHTIDGFLRASGLFFRHQPPVQMETGELFEEIYDVTDDIIERR